MISSDVNTAGLFAGSRIVAAVRTRAEWEATWSSPVKNVFLLGGTVSELPFTVAEAREHGKRLFVHADRVEGLGHDAAAVEFIARLAPFGVISTHAPIVKRAGAAGLCTVLRFFIVDGRSVATALETLSQTRPDYAELMPGLVCKTIRAFADTGIPVIAGGLVTTRAEADDALAAGAVAVSTSAAGLWG